MKITSPRISSLIAIIILIFYVILSYYNIPLPFEFQLVIILLISTFIGIAAFNFAGNELKSTAGVFSVFELGFKKLLGIILFSLFIVAGYDTFLFIVLNLFGAGAVNTQVQTVPLYLMMVLIGFLYLFPFFQGLFLTQPGEQSSIPSEFIIERILEFFVGIFKSPLITSILAYFVAFVFPVYVLFSLFNLDILIAILLWALIPPLVSISALAGAGFGEDLIRLRMIRRPFRDLKKLGTPKISLRKMRFETGGLLLVLIAIQALITTAYFGVRGLLMGFGLIEASGTIGLAALFLTLFNKARGSTKEIKEVWTESGFKVSIFQLFLPVFVFLGIILSAALEVFIGQTNSVAVLDKIGLSDHRQLIAALLAVQNFVLIITAIIILKITPGAAERRLIKEIPKFYTLEDGTPDIDGYLFIYHKLRSDKSIENYLQELAKIMQKDPRQADSLKGIIKESLEKGSESVQVAAAQVLYIIIMKLDKLDRDYLELTKLAFDSPYNGAKIYAVRCLSNLIKFYSDVEKENLIELLAYKISDPDSVVAWDSSLALQRLIIKEAAYRSFVLSFLIRIIQTTENQSSLDAINRFFNRVARESSDVGHMAIATLGIQVSSVKPEKINNIIKGIRAIIRGDPGLSTDLLDQVALGVQSPDKELRKNSFLILMNIAEFSEGIDEEVLELIIQGIDDEAEDIQKVAFEALRNEIESNPENIDYVFTILSEKFEHLRGIALLGALNVIQSIVRLSEYEREVFNLIRPAADSSTDIVRVKLFKIFSDIASLQPTLTEQIYQIVKLNMSHTSAEVREIAVSTLGKCVDANPSLSKAVYRRVKNAKNDESFKVQLAAIEALGHIASVDKQNTSEIFASLKPLLKDRDWQVRLAAFNGLFTASKGRKELQNEVRDDAILILTDSTGVIRDAGVDALQWMINKSRDTADYILPKLGKFVNRVESPIQASIYDVLTIIAKKRILLLPTIFTYINEGFSNELINTRQSALRTLETGMSKLSKSREPTKDVHNALNKLYNKLLQAANNSYIGIRKTAYDGITIICVAVPSFKIAKRGRTAIDKAINLEKDVGLLDVLEKARISSKPPLDFNF